MVETEQTRNDQRYWKIPKEQLSLTGFLEHNGYDIRETGQEKSWDILCNVTEEKFVKLGEIKETFGVPRDSPPFLALRLVYDVINHNQVKAVLELRELLEENEVGYGEKPKREEVAESIRESIRKYEGDLIKRVLGDK